VEIDETQKQRSITIPCPDAIKEQYGKDAPASFTFRRRKVRDSVTIAIRQDDLCAGQKAKMNNEAINLTYALASLAIVLEAPSAFDFGDVEDDIAVTSIFLEYERWRAGFPQPAAPGAPAAGGTAGGHDDRPALP
jgi:hypothetical protein